MDCSFCKPDLEKDGKCESCERDADHVLVLLENKMVGGFQICYDCSVMIEFGGKDYRFIPKKNAKADKRNEKRTALFYPRE
jgi:hypothetical protein